MSWLVFVVFGFLSGVAAGMGMGGGTILIPALTLLLSLDQHAAQGVNMLAFLPAAAAALFIHRKEGRIEGGKLSPILIAGVAAALLGAFLAGLLSSPWLRRLFGVFLLGLSVLQFLRGRKRGKDEKEP